MKFLSYITTSLLLLAAIPLSGQLSFDSARGMGMGGSGLTFKDIQSIWTNQAGLAYMEDWSAAVFGQQHFLVSEIQSAGAAAAIATGSGTFGISANYLGFETYREQKVGLAYGRKLTDGLALGAQFLLLNTNIENYGSRSLFTFEAGMLAELLPQLTIGFHVFSPIRMEWLEGDRVPTIFSLGAGYRPSAKLLITTEVEKDIEYEARFRGGIEYRIVEQLQLRAGVATKPTNVHFGLGFRVAEKINLDAAVRYHQVLGYTPGVGISFN